MAKITDAQLRLLYILRDSGPLPGVPVGFTRSTADKLAAQGLIEWQHIRAFSTQLAITAEGLTALTESEAKS